MRELRARHPVPDFVPEKDKRMKNPAKGPPHPVFPIAEPSFLLSSHEADVVDVEHVSSHAVRLHVDPVEGVVVGVERSHVDQHLLPCVGGRNARHQSIVIAGRGGSIANGNSHSSCARRKQWVLTPGFPCTATAMAVQPPRQIFA
jgi:hypothetical protein